MPVLRFLPLILGWSAMLAVLLRAFGSSRRSVMTAALSGVPAGAAGAFLIIRAGAGSPLSVAVKSLLGISFLLLCATSVSRVYSRRISGGTRQQTGLFSLTASAVPFTATFLVALTAGAVGICTLPAAHTSPAALAVLILCAVLLTFEARAVERILPEALTVSGSGLAALLVSGLLLAAAAVPRLDLFSPLSMKIMKGIHDFVHQFMESILIPDHLFVQPVVWRYIGFLFGKEVGFWGGLVIWFAPVLLILLTSQTEPLPAVAHIRQGAQRRRLLAEAIRNRRLRLAAPLLSLLLFAAAAYRSSYPDIEYWDPKPIPVTAGTGGEIVIPKKGEIDLRDGRLHKYLFRKGEREARFFVLKSPSGALTVDLDACAICKPDGYGQTEGSVICYYCKTLIPIETVGKPGGCNPVPVRFTEKEDSVVIDGETLITSWSTTVQGTLQGTRGRP